MKPPKPYHQQTPASQFRTRKRVVRMLKNGANLTALAASLGLSRQTLYDWRRADADPAVGLASKPMGRQCYLNPGQLERLRGLLLEGALAHGFPTDLWTLERVRQLILRVFDVKYGERSVWFLLREYLDFSPQKPERRAREADLVKTAAWKRQFARRKKKGAA